MPLQVFHPLLQWTMPSPFIYCRFSPALDGKILFCEVALFHLKQFILALSNRHPDTTRDSGLLLGVFKLLPRRLNCWVSLRSTQRTSTFRSNYQTHVIILSTVGTVNSVHIIRHYNVLIVSYWSAEKSYVCPLGR